MQLNSTQLANLQAQLATLSRTIAGLRRELKAPASPPATAVPVPVRPTVRPQFPGYRLLGQEFTARNANDILVALFRHFAELEPAFPERFQRAVRGIGRSRRYVGRSPQEVYPSKPKLWRSTVEFAPGWYIGTNENNKTKLKLLRRASEVLGLRFGSDVRVWM
jgi:hypothetical protein